MRGGNFMKDISESCIKIGVVEGEEGIIEISASRLKKWRSCQMAHDYKYVRGLRPKRKAVPLRKGTWVHACLEARDSGQDWIEVIKKLKAEEYDKLFEEEKVELGDLPKDVFRMMRAYHQTYLNIDKEYETVKCEQDFMIRIPNTKFVLTGRIDKISKHKSTGKIWCFEHKTMKKSIPTEDFRATDIQTAIYIWVMEQIASYLNFKKEDIAGVMFDYIRTKPPTVPKILKNGTMSVAKIDCDRWTYTAELKKHNLNPADYESKLKELDSNVFFVRIPMSRSTSLVKTVMQEVLYSGIQIQAYSGKCPARNLNWTCDRPKCEYRDVCMTELQGGDASILIKLNFTQEGVDEDGNIEEDEYED